MITKDEKMLVNAVAELDRIGEKMSADIRNDKPAYRKRAFKRNLKALRKQREIIEKVDSRHLRDELRQIKADAKKAADKSIEFIEKMGGAIGCQG